MSTAIHKKVELARLGQNPNVIAKLKSGWVVIADTQPLDGYCLLFPDPVVPDLNSLDEQARIQYLLDTTRVGDALLKATDAYRINYETWGNLDPALHTHIVPRYMNEPFGKRIKPAMFIYDYKLARAFDPEIDKELIAKLREFLRPYSV